MTNISKLKPLGHRLLVKKIEEQQTTAAGIYLGSSEKRSNERGTIIATGPGRISPSGTLIPLACKSGDEIIYNIYAALQIDNDHIIINEDEVLAIITY